MEEKPQQQVVVIFLRRPWGNSLKLAISKITVKWFK